MLNFRELLNWLDDKMDLDEYCIIDKHLVKQNDYELCAPIKYRGIWEHIGYATIWNSVGCIEYEFQMYRPVGNGTVVYDVE